MIKAATVISFLIVCVSAFSAHADSKAEQLETYSRCGGLYKAIAGLLHDVPAQNINTEEQVKMADKYRYSSAQFTAKAASLSDQQTAIDKMNGYALNYRDQINRDKGPKSLLPLVPPCNKLLAVQG